MTKVRAYVGLVFAATALLAACVCALLVDPGIGSAQTRGRCPTSGSLVFSAANVRISADRGRGHYVACWAPDGRITQLARMSQRDSNVGFATVGHWIVVEQVRGRSCSDPRTLRSINATNGREGYTVTIHTCHVGSPSDEAGVPTAEGPNPWTAFNDGPAPAIVHKRLKGIVIAADGDFAWSISAATYPGSYDRKIFGSVAAGLFAPAGNGQDTNLWIIPRSRIFPTLVIQGDVLSWYQGAGTPKLSYQMPAPGSKVLPITVHATMKEMPV
jgi:hypothetical protein